MEINSFKNQIIDNQNFIVSNLYFKDLISFFTKINEEKKNDSSIDLKNIKLIYISNFKKLNLEEFNLFMKLDIISSIDIYTTRKRSYSRKKHSKKPSFVFFIVELNSNCTIKDGAVINKKLSKLIKYYKKHNINIGFNSSSNDLYFSNVMTNSKDLNDDISNILISNLYNNLYNKYTYIYDVVCDKLDQNFIINNFCDFKDNKCIANRDSDNIERDNGCCHSFIRNKNIPHSKTTEELTLCKHLNEDKHCNIKSISCKFFVCQYLKNRGIYFDILDNFLLRSIFNRKQLDVIHINFFKSEEEIIKKLIKVKNNYLPYKLYIKLRMQLIDNYWEKIPEKQ